MKFFPTLSDDCIASISAHDNGEVMVALTSTSQLLLDTSAENLTHLGYKTDFHLRQTAASRLLQAAAYLPPNLVLLVKECFRPIAIQERYFSRYIGQLMELYPEMDMQSLVRLASRYVAPPELASHATGGAVDVALMTDNGVLLDMGTPYDAAPEECDESCFTDAVNISNIAILSRTILKNAMSAAGFVNYPYEWWHWSYGDRYWAYVLGSATACYGVIQPKS